MINGFNLSLELSGHKTKSFAGILVEAAFALGEAYVAILAIKIRDWKDYQVTH